MHTINLSEFQHYDSKAIYTYILTQSETEYRVLMHKESDANTDRFEIFWEYHIAGYIGEKLAQIAETFAYYVPSVKTRQAFSFDILIYDQEQFADTLYFLITGLYENDTDITIHFHGEATKVYIDAFEVQEFQPACFGLIELASRYLH